MRNLIKSMASFSWGMTLLGAKSLVKVVTPRRSGERLGSELDAVAKAAGEQLDGVFKTAYDTADKVQSQVLNTLFNAGSAVPGHGPRPLPSDPSDPHGHYGKAFDASTFVVLGDGLAAGMGHFSLEGGAQITSFPALMARSLGTAFPQPLFQAPGLGDVIGLEPQKPIVPNILQSTVLAQLPETADLGNLAVPGFSVEDAVGRRPVAPLVDRESSLRTLTNFILGMPDLRQGAGPGKTQLEYAQARKPTLALVCYGYDALLKAAVHGDVSLLPSGGTFQADLVQLLQGLGHDPLVIVTTIPDPLSSGYFSSREVAAKILKTTPEFLEQQWHIGANDLVRLPGLYAMGYQTMGRKVGPLDCSPVIDQATAGAVRTALDDLNTAIRAAAAFTGAQVFDLHGVVEGLVKDGLSVGGKVLTTEYLGGLYLLNGVYPGPTANALVAADIVRYINETFGQEFVEPSITAIAATDANTQTELAPGGPSTDAFLKPRTADEIPDVVTPLPAAVQEVPIQTTYPNLDPAKAGCEPAIGVPAAGFQDPTYSLVAPDHRNPDFKPLTIPPEGMEYTLDVNQVTSYFGDALRPVDCPGEPPFVPGLPPFGTCQNTFFGGFLPTTSQLRGKIHLKFSPPKDGKTLFEIRHPGGLHGSEGDLAGPLLFNMPVQHTVVRDIERLVSSGVLDLETGMVFNFHYNVQNMNTALHSLLALNPGVALPALSAAALTFPGLPNAGSSWAQFNQRSDGKLDVSLAGHMFVPFGLDADGRPVRFALPFTTPDLKAASFVARGTSLHPRIFLTSLPTPAVTDASKVPEIPFNTVQEFTSFSSSTFFGDAFDLHAPELGEGGAIGRSQLVSRVRVQFGAKTNNTVPVVLQVLPPGGLLNNAPVPPPFLPPGTSRGEAGFDTVLHFPKQTYPQSGLSNPDDPLNISATSILLDSGQMVSPLLWRGYVVQELFMDLIQVEPCTPSDSFNYQGPASFEKGEDGELILRWNGLVFLPYPKGFNFPSPNPGGRPPFVIQGDSRLDPFRSIQAMQSRSLPPAGKMSGEVDNAQSPSTGARFSYKYSIPFNPARAGEAAFEYTNHTDGGTFELKSLTWFDFTRSRGSSAPANQPDTVTFSGFGTWSKDPGGVHQVSVQISVAKDAPFVGILVDGGPTSNVDIKPEKIQLA